MAWTRLLPSGNYQGLYRDATGDERSAGTFTQHAEALRKAGAKEVEQRGPLALDIDGGKITWEAWFELWMDSRMLAYATEDCYRSTASNHITPVFGRTRIMDFETLRISKWVKEMLRPPKRSTRKPSSPWVVRNALMLMKTSLNAAVEAKRLGVSPARTVAYPDLPEGLERYLTPEEVEAITFYMDGKNALIVWMGVQTGLRFGELAGLHWKRLDLDRGAIRVVEKFDQKARVMDPVPKDKEERTVPLPPDLVGMLRRYAEHAAPQRQTDCGVHHASGRCESDLVFRGARGAVLKSNDWGKGPWKAALALAGIEDRVRPHDMRHTYASWLIQEGLPIPELARVMGHSDWEVTKRYAHLSDAGFDAVRDALTKHRGVEPEPEPDMATRVEALEKQLADLSGRTAARAANTHQTTSYDAVSTTVEQAG
jgi:integrase